MRTCTCRHMLKIDSGTRGDAGMVDMVKTIVAHLEDLVLEQQERETRRRDRVSEWQRKVPLFSFAVCPPLSCCLRACQRQRMHSRAAGLSLRSSLCCVQSAAWLIASRFWTELANPKRALIS